MSCSATFRFLACDAESNYTNLADAFSRTVSLHLCELLIALDFLAVFASSLAPNPNYPTCTRRQGGARLLGARRAIAGGCTVDDGGVRRDFHLRADVYFTRLQSLHAYAPGTGMDDDYQKRFCRLRSRISACSAPGWHFRLLFLVLRSPQEKSFIVRPLALGISRRAHGVCKCKRF